jgi:AcrR family transcriptional regulator
MGRRRAIPDASVLRAVLGLIRRVGPDGVTFALAAAETGLSGASLVQRFGSKAGLVRAALLCAWDDLDRRTAALDRETGPTPAGAVDLLVALSAEHGLGESYADDLLLLREDMRDPELRARGAAWGEALARALGRRLDPTGTRSATLGRLMASQWQGALLWWGFERGRPAGDAVRDALSAWCVALFPSGRP